MVAVDNADLLIFFFFCAIPLYPYIFIVRVLQGCSMSLLAWLLLFHFVLFYLVQHFH